MLFYFLLLVLFGCSCWLYVLVSICFDEMFQFLFYTADNVMHTILQESLLFYQWTFCNLQFKHILTKLAPMEIELLLLTKFLLGAIRKNVEWSIKEFWMSRFIDWWVGQVICPNYSKALNNLVNVVSILRHRRRFRRYT